VQPHQGDSGQWTLVADLGTDQPGEQDGDKQCPAGREEAKANTELAFYPDY
jgi:hypothetical protein